MRASSAALRVVEETSVSDERYWRQLDVLPPREAAATPVTVIGVGAIGSFAALTLAKMGFRRLRLYDPDVVQPHNLPVQFFREADLGRPKVEAAGDLLRAFEGVEAELHAEAFAPGERVNGGVVLVAVDTMDARIGIWRGLKRRSHADFLVDARMGAEVLRVYAARPAVRSQARFYEGTLYPSSEAVREPCTSRAVLYTVLAAASEAASLIKRHVRGESVPREIVRDFAGPTLISR